MASLTPAQAELFKEANYAVLTTIRADGSPHNTPVWVDIDGGGTVSINTVIGRAKHRHLERDPRIALTLMKEPYKWVSITGRVSGTTTDGANDQIDKLAKKYLGEDKYPWHHEGDVRIAATIAIDKVDSFGVEG